MGYGESAIEAVSWRDLEVLGGTGEDLRAAIVALFHSTTHAEAHHLWWRFENVVFAQDTIYGAAEETVNVFLAALADDRPRVVRRWIIEILFFLVKGGAEDPALPGRVRDRARPGLWLLAQEARVTSGQERESVLNVIDCIDESYAEFIRASLTSSS